MQVFKTFFKVSKKYRTVFFVYTAIFVALFVIFVSDKADESKDTFEASKLKISVIDHDDSALSSSLVTYLETHHETVKIKEDMQSIRDQMYQRSVDYILMIPEGFEKKVISSVEIFSASNSTDFDASNQLISYKIPGSLAGKFADSQINKFISVYSSYMVAGYDPDTITEKTLDTLSLETQVSVKNYSDNEEGDSLIHIYYSYLAYIQLSIITLCIAPILIVFNKKEIRNRTALSCVSYFKKNIGLTLASCIYMFVLFLIFTLPSLLLWPDDMLTGIGALRIINIAIYSLIALAMAFLLATLLPNENMLTFIVNFVGLAGGFLCGIFIPKELLSKAVLNFSKILPAHWYINVENELTNYNALSQLTHSSNMTILYGFIIQALFAAALFSIGMVISKSRKSV